MAEITCVSFVPKGDRAKLRHVLMTEDTGELRWRERKRMFGSEFYFSGPAPIVMKTHAYVTYWLADAKARRSGAQSAAHGQPALRLG